MKRKFSSSTCSGVVAAGQQFHCKMTQVLNSLAFKQEYNQLAISLAY